MSGEKVGFLAAGVAFSCLTAILYAKRRWYARLTVDFMFFWKDQAFREAKADEFERVFKLLLGRVFPIFMAIWLIGVVVA